MLEQEGSEPRNLVGVGIQPINGAIIGSDEQTESLLGFDQYILANVLRSSDIMRLYAQKGSYLEVD